MKLFEKKNVIRIDEDDLRDAGLSSMDFADETTKKRVFTDILGARLAMKMLFEKKIQASNIYSLYTIHNVIEELDIADIYFQDIKIDVRLVFNREEIFIPKSHFQYGLLPDIYLVLELNDDLSSADFVGFFEPKTLNQDNATKDFYFHEADRLLDPKDIKTFLEGFAVENNFMTSEDDTEHAEELFLSLVDKEISKGDKHFLFEQLAKSISLREKMVEFENFEVISKEVSKNQEMLKDGVLDIVGAQKLFETEADVEDIQPEMEDFEELLFEPELQEDEIFADSIDFDTELSEYSELEELESPNEGFGEFSELETLKNIDESLAEYPMVQEPELKQDEEVFSLDDFDFDMLNETEEIPQGEIQDRLEQLEEVREPQKAEKNEDVQSEEGGDVLQKLRQLEDLEQEETEEVENKKQTQDNSDEFLSQVDEFLKDVELSDDKMAFLGGALFETVEEIGTINTSQISESNYANDKIAGNFNQKIEAVDDDNDLLKVLFENGAEDELSGLKTKERNVNIPTFKNQKMVIAASLAGVVLTSLVIGISMLHKKTNEVKFPQSTTAPISAEGQASDTLSPKTVANADNLQMPEQTIDSTMQQPMPGEGAQANANKDMGKAVSDAFLSEPVSASISKVAWEVPEDLAYNDSFRKYLQIAGKNLKLNLQNNLLLATEMAYSNKVVVDLIIKKDGSLQSSEITSSSGSKQIDKIVLQSVKETLQYLKMPSSELSKGSADATLIINF